MAVPFRRRGAGRRIARVSEQSFVARAAAALRAGDRPGALSLLQQALARDPQDINALIASAKMAQADGHNEQARQLAARAVQAGPGNLTAWVVRSELDHVAGDMDAALAGFQAAHKLAPDNAALPFNIGLSARA